MRVFDLLDGHEVSRFKAADDTGGWRCWGCAGRLLLLLETLVSPAASNSTIDSVTAPSTTFHGVLQSTAWRSTPSCRCWPPHQVSAATSWHPLTIATVTAQHRKVAMGWPPAAAAQAAVVAAAARARARLIAPSKQQAQQAAGCDRRVKTC